MDPTDSTVLREFVRLYLQGFPREHWGRALAWLLSEVVAAYTELYFSSVEVIDVDRPRSPAD